MASLASRQSDVLNHPNHRAYIWGKKLGVSKAYLKAATGVFFGRSNDCENMKGYAKVYAEGKLLSRRRTLANIEILLQKTAYRIDGRLYAEIGGNTVVNRNLYVNGANQCSTYNTHLSRSRYRLFSFTYSIFVYIGSVGVTIHVDLGMSVSFDAGLCTSSSVYSLASGTAGFIPQINLYAGGSAHVTLLVRINISLQLNSITLWAIAINNISICTQATVRAGITAEVELAYQMEPQATARVCAVNCQASSQTCVRAYESWPGNSINLYAWYQTRRIRWCGGWVSITMYFTSWPAVTGSPACGSYIYYV